MPDLAPIPAPDSRFPPDPETTPPGRMLTAVEADLSRMEMLDKGVRGSLAALARELARAMDATGDDQPTPAQVGQLGQQLRTTLLALAEVTGDSSAAEAFFRLMSTAVRDASDPEPQDPGTTRCPNCRAARQASDAVATNGHGRSPGTGRRRAPSIPHSDLGGDAAER